MNKSFQLFKRFDWLNVTFLTLTPLCAAAGLYFLIRYQGLRWPTVIFALFYTAATGLAVTAGYHRLFSHVSYVASRPLKFMLLLLGAAGFENSVLVWASDHRNHHKFVDTDLDPYNFQRGFWFAHIGWVLLKREETDFSNVADLEKDPLVRWQRRYFFGIAAVMGFGVPVLITSLWHDVLGGIILVGFLRVVLNHHFTFSINSFCHYMGTQPFSDHNSSRDSWVPALLTYGEGYHNYHHTFPTDYRNAVHAYQWDPTKWFIGALNWVGQARHLRRIEDKKILEVQIRMEEKRLLQKVAHVDAPHRMRDAIASARANLEAAYARFQTLRAAYQKAKAEKASLAAAQRTSFNERLKEHKRTMQQTKKDFKSALISWRRLCSSFQNSAFIPN